MKKQFIEPSIEDLNKKVEMEIENPMIIVIMRVTHFSNRCFSVLLHNRVSWFLILMIKFTFKSLFKSQRMKRKVLSLLMGLSLVILMIVGRIIQ